MSGKPINMSDKPITAELVLYPYIDENKNVKIGNVKLKYKNLNVPVKRQVENVLTELEAFIKWSLSKYSKDDATKFLNSSSLPSNQLDITLIPSEISKSLNNIDDNSSATEPNQIYGNTESNGGSKSFKYKKKRAKTTKKKRAKTTKRKRTKTTKRKR